MKHEVNINTKEESLSEVIAKVSGFIEFLPEGLWQISIGKPRSTPKQIRTEHAIFKEAAVQLDNIEFKIHFGRFEMTPNEHVVKEFFKGAYLAGQSTTKVTTKELAEALTKFMNDVNAHLVAAGTPKEQLIYVKSKDILNLLNKN